MPLKIRSLLLASCFLFPVAAHSATALALDYEDYPTVKLRTLDKITARTMTFEAKVGATMKFGEIFIKVQTCRKPPPVQKTEAAAFLQIWQNDASKSQASWIFSGWMFASSPALSAMNHSVYDVWVIDCLGRDPEALPLPEEAGATQDGGVLPSGEGATEAPPAEELGENGQSAAPVQTESDPVFSPGSQPEQEIVSSDPADEETVPAANMPADKDPAAPSAPVAPIAPAPEGEKQDENFQGLY